MDLETLHEIRLFEVNLCLDQIRQFRNSGRLVEVGAGTGFQAKFFAERGFDVEAIDLVESNYSDNQIYPVKSYNGEDLPFSDNSIDIVFSSNVLEHVQNLSTLQSEIHRVLKPDGIAVHVLPSGTWRLWTTVLHPFLEPIRIIRARRKNRKLRASPSSFNNSESSQNSELTAGQSRSIIDFFKLGISILIPKRHGERGNAVTEIFWFSKMAWNSQFKKSGWTIISHRPSRLFYEGSLVPSSIFSIRVASMLSRIMGSSTHVYVVAASDKSHHLYQT